LHPCHCFLKHGIADIGPVCVIRIFEVIQVRHNYCRARSTANCSADFLLQGFANGAAAEATGQTTMRGLKAQLFAGKSELILQFEDELSGADAGLQFSEIKRLGDIVVRTWPSRRGHKRPGVSISKKSGRFGSGGAPPSSKSETVLSHQGRLPE
jgi:hypothetical protein